MDNDILARLHQRIKEFEFTNYSFVKIQTPATFPHYQNWLQKGHQADMSYLEFHSPIKKNPELKWPGIRTALVFSQNYFPHPEPSNSLDKMKNLKIAKYARGKDYHHWFQEKLQRLATALEQEFPDIFFSPITDSSPLLERNWAFEAGLGWFGKNSCLIHQKYGSFHFLGEILTSLELENKIQIHPDLCGKCNKCVEACPTQALVGDKTLDANKCISYWTIETRKTPPMGLRSKFNDWLFGCDICQDVCPWNIKAFKINENEIPINLEGLEYDLKWILESSNHSLKKHFRGTPFLRTGPTGLKKNAILIAGQRRFTSLKSSIQKYSDHNILGEISNWALSELSNSDSLKTNV